MAETWEDQSQHQRTRLNHARLFTGDIWYVDGTNGHDTDNPGNHPGEAFATIAAAITKAVAGDAITVRAGSYDENSLDLNLDGMEMWGEIGAVILNTAGTECLTVSGDNCRVDNMEFEDAGIIGIVVTGNECVIENCTSKDTTVGFDIDGQNNHLIHCHDLDSTTTGFDIAHAGNLLEYCTSIADGGSSRGYYLSHANADKNTIIECHSIGNGTAGFECITGTAANHFHSCSSGKGDGQRVDTDHNNSWHMFSFDNEQHKLLTFNATGGASVNLFKITGVVNIKRITGHVDTVLSADVDEIYLDLWDGTTAFEITDSGGGGTDISSAPEGSFLMKTAAASVVITYQSSGAGFVVENTNWREPTLPFAVGEKAGVDTFIRAVYAGTGTSGAIDFHIEWEPLSDDGFVEEV